MKKVFFCLSLMFAFSLMSFTSPNEIDTVLDDNIITETSIDGTAVEYEVIYDAFDICTIIVTITYSNGDSYSAKASNNKGDCAAAREDAEERARLEAAVIGGH